MKILFLFFSIQHLHSFPRDLNESLPFKSQISKVRPPPKLTLKSLGKCYYLLNSWYSHRDIRFSQQGHKCFGFSPSGRNRIQQVSWIFFQIKADRLWNDNRQVKMERTVVEGKHNLL